jgi:hypothetical protein
MPAIQQSSPRSEAQLAGLCAELGAARIGPLSRSERDLLARAEAIPESLAGATLHAIESGEDPLGTAFCTLRSPADRRDRGATYTPLPIVRSMLAWAASQEVPARIIDPGTGSARFLRDAAGIFPTAKLLGIELDPLAALMARANLAVAGLEKRSEVHLADYRAFEPESATEGPTLFIGNPPYVRHHDIEPDWKAWLSRTASDHGLAASRLAGLHVHFFLATLQHARPGDFGAFITASEWLDVNYGKLVRDLLAGPLGIERMDILDPKVEPFADAQTTAVITCFKVGSRAKSVAVQRVHSVDELTSLSAGTSVPRVRLAASTRWSNVHRARGRATDLVELGELCRVHRGQVTGGNAVWIAGPDTPSLPAAVIRPTMTKARELFATDGALHSSSQLRRVVDLPRDLDDLSESERSVVDAFIVWARHAGAHDSYIARHRKPWWAVRLRAPAPILATYMARRPPAFVRNLAQARHINIAHGLYPRDDLSTDCLDVLAAYLGHSVSTDEGRTYAGGLTKFEPKEMERLLVPTPEVLAQLAADKRAA